MKVIKLLAKQGFQSNKQQLNQQTLLQCLCEIDTRNNLSAWHASHYTPQLLLDNDVWLMLGDVDKHKSADAEALKPEDLNPEKLNPETIVGFAVTKSVLDEAELLLIVIDKKWQQQGNGGKLLQHLAQHLQNQAISMLFLEVNVDNLGAIKLYENSGFKAVNIRKNYYRKSQQAEQSRDALVMQKELVTA